MWGEVAKGGEVKNWTKITISWRCRDDLAEEA